MAADGALVAAAEPAWLVATTMTRIVKPASAPVRLYELPVAPAIESQVPPQRCHWNVVTTPAGDQSPAVAERDLPATGWPLICGSVELTGTDDTVGDTGAGAGATMAVAAVVELVDPAEFWAVTVARSVRVTSAVVTP